MPLDDTHPDIHAMQILAYRSMSPAQKFRLVEDMWETLQTLAFAGVRSRHPGSSPAEEQRYLAEVLLGLELANRVHGCKEWKP